MFERVSHHKSWRTLIASDTTLFNYFGGGVQYGRRNSEMYMKKMYELDLRHKVLVTYVKTCFNYKKLLWNIIIKLTGCWIFKRFPVFLLYRGQKAETEDYFMFWEILFLWPPSWCIATHTKISRTIYLRPTFRRVRNISKRDCLISHVWPHGKTGRILMKFGICWHFENL